MPDDAAGGAAGGAAIPEAVLTSARQGEPDRLVAALLAPPALRADLVALAAFAAEVGAIPARVREPMMGAIRLQWWHDAVDAAARGAASGHPTADCLGRTVSRHALDPALLHAVIEARLADVSGAPFADLPDLLRHLDHTEGALFQLTLAVAGLPQGASTAGLAEAAGHAYGLVRRLTGAGGGAGPHPAIPADRLLAAGLAEADLAVRPLEPSVMAALGRIAAELQVSGHAALARARSAAAGHPQALPALLPLAMVEPYFRGLNRQPLRLLDGGGDVTPLYRMWRLWHAHLRSRF